MEGTYIGQYLIKKVKERYMVEICAYEYCLPSQKLTFWYYQGTHLVQIYISTLAMRVYDLNVPRVLTSQSYMSEFIDKLLETIPDKKKDIEVEKERQRLKRNGDLLPTEDLIFKILENDLAIDNYLEFEPSNSGYNLIYRFCNMDEHYNDAVLLLFDYRQPIDKFQILRPIHGDSYVSKKIKDSISEYRLRMMV